MTSLYRESMVTRSTNEQPSVLAAASDKSGNSSAADRGGNWGVDEKGGVGEVGEGSGDAGESGIDGCVL